MTKDEVKAVLDRVLTWPADRQEAAARILSEMEEQDNSSLALSDEQVVEVQRRLADPEPKFLTLEEVRGRFVHRRARRSSSAMPRTAIWSEYMLGSQTIVRAPPTQ